MQDCQKKNKVDKELKYTVCQAARVKRNIKQERRIGSLREGAGLADLDKGCRKMSLRWKQLNKDFKNIY